MKNKPFDEMTAAEKRVAIAQDVVKQIKARNYLPDLCYVVLPDNAGSINQTSVKAAKICKVCAIGAALVSSIRLGNSVSIPGFHTDSSETRGALRKWFSKTQIENMEAAYEGFSWLGTDEARIFGANFTKGADRMTAIFRNIIANKGTFKP